MDINRNFKDFCSNIVKNKIYIISLLFFNLLAYGFNLANRTVSMDDLAFDVFGKGGWGISGMRWSIYLFAPLFNTKNYSPFIGRFIALVLLILSSILFSFLVYSINENKKNIVLYIVLSVIFTTYPLINEMWEFVSMNVNVNFNGISIYFLFMFLALIYEVYCNKFSVKNIVVTSILLIPVAAGYESVMFVYVTLALIIIYHNCKNKNDNYNWFVDGIRYAIPLVIALLIRFVIGYLLIFIFNVPARPSTGRSYWAVNGMIETLKSLLYNGWYYIIRGLSYFPIGEFVIASVLFVIFVIKDAKNRKILLLIGLFIYISLFLLSIVQGYYLYYRMAQTIQVFVSYVAYLIIERTINIDKKLIKNIIIICLAFVCLRQSICLHEVLALNNQRSENEAFIAREIGYKIYSEFNKDKTVIFCGEYQLGNFIEKQITVKEGSLASRVEEYVRKIVGHDEGREYQEFVCTNVNSYFNKQMDAFNSQLMIKEYLSYYGFDINVLENLTDEEEDKLKGYYEKIAKEEKMKPLEIKDMGEYILVYLGPTIDGYDKLKYE